MGLAIVSLVRAFWLASILPMAIDLIPSSKLSSIHEFVLGYSGRGKILQSQVFTHRLTQLFLTQKSENLFKIPVKMVVGGCEYGFTYVLVMFEEFLETENRHFF